MELKWLGGRQKLSEQQDRFAEIMKPLGLERGKTKSKANHKTIQKFYAELEEKEEGFKAILKDFPKKRMIDSHQEYMKSVETHLMSFPDVKEVLKESKTNNINLINAFLERINKVNHEKNIDLSFNLNQKGDFFLSVPSETKKKKEKEVKKKTENKTRHKRSASEGYLDVIFKELYSEKPAKETNWHFVKDCFDKMEDEAKDFVIRSIINNKEGMQERRKNSFLVITDTVKKKNQIIKELKKQEPIVSKLKSHNNYNKKILFRNK